MESQHMAWAHGVETRNRRGPREQRCQCGNGNGSGDWRAGLAKESRINNVKWIMEILQRHMPVAGPGGMNDLLNIADRFEQKVFAAATDEEEYMQKISVKISMLALETRGGVAEKGDPGAMGVLSNQNQPSVCGIKLSHQVLVPVPRQQPSEQPLQFGRQSFEQHQELQRRRRRRQQNLKQHELLHQQQPAVLHQSDAQLQNALQEMHI